LSRPRRTPQAALGKTDRELELPEHLIPFWEEAVRRVFRTGERRIIGFEMPTPHGHRHYEAHLVPEFAPDGSTEHVLAITRDITEHVRMEEALRESEERSVSTAHRGRRFRHGGGRTNR
jgi:PAS domain S-box-containing protein